MNDLSAAGLNPTEAKCYRSLLTKKSWLPSELAQNVQETRTNVYKILDKLVGLQLAERLENGKKLRYRAANPARLLELARQNRLQREQAERSLEVQAQSLFTDYVKVHEQAAVTYYQGTDEIAHIFEAIAGSKEEVVFVHSLAGINSYGFTAMHNLRMMAANAGVHRRALTPDSPLSPADYAESDPQVLLHRTWLDANDYTAPVEWGAFEDKLYIISYGQEAMGMLIDSPQISAAFRQLFNLLERRQQQSDDYKQLPRLAKAKGSSTPRL